MTRRLGVTAGPSSSISHSPTRQPAPDRETVARALFFDQFVTQTHLSCLNEITPDEFLMRPILACALVVLANRRGDDTEGRKLARQYYIDAITAINAALRHSQRVKEDGTVIAVFLLGVFERVNWDGPESFVARGSHVKGTSMCLQLRGRNQTRTKSGAALFRDMRTDIITHALMSETSVPEFVQQLTQSLEYDPIHTAYDELVILASRVAAMRESFVANTVEDRELLGTANTLEQDLLSWSEAVLSSSSLTSFHNIEDPDSKHAWSGMRHEYGMPQAYRYWNLYRCLRILLSRTQEALWRRSWPILVQPHLPMPSADSFKTVRNRMAEDICVATAYAFGNDSSADPPGGAVSSGLLLLNPLTLAGTHLLEPLVPTTTTPGGSKLMLVREAYHNDPNSHVSTQLAWVIERLEYIANKVGVRWAETASKFLKGETNVCYSIERSRSLRRQDPELPQQDSMLDLANIFRTHDLD